MNKKIILAIAYVAGLLIAYLLFIDYNLAQYLEYNEIQKAKWIARGFSPEFYDGYVREGFISTAYGRNVINLAPVLIFVGLIGAFILLAVSRALSNRKEQQRKQKNTRAHLPCASSSFLKLNCAACVSAERFTRLKHKSYYDPFYFDESYVANR